MSYHMHMNMLRDVYREEDYPAPAGFPKLSSCGTSVPVMEDYLRINCMGEPKYHAAASILAYTRSHWDNTVSYKDQYFIERVCIRHITPEMLQLLSTGALCQEDIPEETFSAGGSVENQPSILSDGTVLFLSNAAVKDPLPERGSFEQRIINELFIAPQLYSAKNGEVCQITHMLHGIESYQISPDEKYLLFRSPMYYEHDDMERMQMERSSEERLRLLQESRFMPIVYEGFPFKSDAELGYASKRKNTWWLLDLSDYSVRAVNDGSFPFACPCFSPDSRSLIFLDPSAGETITLKKLELFDLTREPVVYLTCKDSFYDYDMNSFFFTKDKKSILFPAREKKAPYSAPRYLKIAAIEEGKEVISTTLVDPLDLIGGVFSDDFNFHSRGSDGNDVVLTEHGLCYFVSGHDGDSALAVVPVDGSAKPKIISDTFMNFHDLIPVSDRLLIALYADPKHFAEPVLISVNKDDSGIRVIPLTASNPWLKGKKLMQPVAIHTKTLDRKETIQGLVLAPPDIVPDRKYPAILYVHGGPNGFYCSAMNYEFQAIAAAGFYVIFGNPRGGSGFGKEHARDENAYGSIAMNDLICLVDEACRRFPEIDEDRIGITGGSYGGYATIWAASHANRYKAASAIRPLANMQMIACSSLNAGGSPADGEFDSFLDALYEAIRQSPNSYADHIGIPFQILQSEKDGNCVPDQMHQLYTSIKDLHPDLPCRMVLYPDSGHGLLQKGPMYLAVMQRIDNLRWFERYL